MHSPNTLLEDVDGAALESVDVCMPLDLAAALSGCQVSVIEGLARISVISTRQHDGQSLCNLRDALRVERDAQARAARKRERAEAAKRRARRGQRHVA
jgi:hypothetical protein